MQRAPPSLRSARTPLLAVANQRRQISGHRLLAIHQEHFEAPADKAGSADGVQVYDLKDMEKHFIAPTTYFLQEGKENLDECLRVSFQAAKDQNINTIIIFTARGDGIKKALAEYRSQPDYARVRLVAVTFPKGKRFRNADNTPFEVRIAEEDRALFNEKNIPVVSAHFPFDGLRGAGEATGALARDLHLIADALNMFSGSMSLCVQSVGLACDAGHVDIGEHVISMTADTSILATATVTRNLLSNLIIREVLCKPAILTIARGEPSPAAQVPNNLSHEKQSKRVPKNQLKAGRTREKGRKR